MMRRAGVGLVAMIVGGSDQRQGGALFVTLRRLVERRDASSSSKNVRTLINDGCGERLWGTRMRRERSATATLA